MNKAVVFDMDGVIFDSEHLIYECWKKIGPKYNFNTLDTVFFKVLGTNMQYTEQVFKAEYGENIPYKEFREEARYAFFDTIARAGIPVKKGVKELLEYLKTTDYKIGLASSTRLEVVSHELKMAGLYDYFDVVIGGDLLENSKPEPDIYIMACEKLGADPKKSYAIEDSYNGIRSAFSANMIPIMVPDMVAPDDEMRQKAFAIKNDLIEVMEMFKQA